MQLNWAAMITLQDARRYQALLSENVVPSPYDYGTLFAAKGWWARRRAKARFKLLLKLDPKLLLILRPEERVFFISTGVLSNVGEQYFGGSLAYYINLRALIFTTERVILIQIGGNQKPRDLVSELPYTAIKQVKSTWTGFCELVLANGKKHRFTRMAGADRKFLRDFLAGVVNGEHTPDGMAKQADGFVHLCPHCFTGVPGWPASCGSCGGGFKSARTAALLSLVLPGLGDFYLGHRGFGALKLFGVLFAWFVLVIGPLLGLATQEGKTQGPLDAGYWTVVVMILLGSHAIDAALSHRFARKGHYPAKSADRPERPAFTTGS